MATDFLHGSHARLNGGGGSLNDIKASGAKQHTVRGRLRRFTHGSDPLGRCSATRLAWRFDLRLQQTFEL